MKTEAVDLFGGEGKLKDKIANEVSRQLKKIKPDQLDYQLGQLEETLHLEEGILENLLNNGDTVEMDVFMKISTPLGISVFDVFGKPNWNKESRKLWNNERQKKPMFVTAFCNGGGKKPSQIPLDMYVTFRALQALCKK